MAGCTDVIFKKNILLKLMESRGQCGPVEFVRAAGIVIIGALSRMRRCLDVASAQLP